MNWMPEAIRDGIIVVLVISGPLVIAAALIGLIIGVLQAATQVQEQTIGSALKIIGVFAIIIFAGYWMYQYLNQYTSRTLSSAFLLVPRQEQKVVPANAFHEEFFKEQKKETQVLRKLPAYEINTKEIQALPLNRQLLGAPEIPKTPSVKEILPPQVPVKGIQTVRPNIPALQEAPIIKPPQSKQTNDQLLNLVPGKPLNLNPEIDLWQREEVTLENNEIENKNEEENPPSWLNQ